MWLIYFKFGIPYWNIFIKIVITLEKVEQKNNNVGLKYSISQILYPLMFFYNEYICMHTGKLSIYLHVQKAVVVSYN